MAHRLSPLGMLAVLDNSTSQPASTTLLRGDNAQRHLRAFNVPPNSRLAYHPQPDASEIFTPSYEVGPDYAFSHFVENAERALGSRSCAIIKARELETALQHANVFFATCLDVYAAMPECRTIPIVDNCIRVLHKLEEEARIHVSYGEDEYTGNAYHYTGVMDVIRCADSILLQQLALYGARRDGLSIEKTKERTENAVQKFGAPEDWCEHAELARIGRQVQERLARYGPSGDDDDVVLEPVNGHVEVDSFTMPLYSEYVASSNMECAVCGDTPTMLTDPCKHAYCRECITHWTTSCGRMSHTCPYCRRNLFPEPKYRLKAQQPQEFEHDIDRRRLNSLLAMAEVAALSLQWLHASIAFELDCARDIKQNEEHSVILRRM